MESRLVLLFRPCDERLGLSRYGRGHSELACVRAGVRVCVIAPSSAVRARYSSVAISFPATVGLTSCHVCVEDEVRMKT